MEIIGSSKEKSTVYIAVLALALIGVILLVSTWQILQRQKEAGLKHLELTAIAVLQAVDSSLRRDPLMGRNRFSTDTRDFFRELETNGDILFVSLVDDTGQRLGLDTETTPRLTFPADTWETLRTGSRWQGVVGYGSGEIYTALRRFQRVPPREGRHLHRENRMQPSLPSEPALFLTVAVDMEKHLAVYREFRKNALLQTAYTLAAAMFLWAMAVRFLSRRTLARKALVLERVQAKLIDNLPDGLLLVDASGRIFAVNPAARTILSASGRNASLDLVGQNLAEITGSFSPPVNSAEDKGWQQTALGGLHLELRILPFPAEGNTGLEQDTPSRMAIIRDRTRIRMLENDLAEAEKLAAIGSLAAGVAHEIRNPLSALRGFAQYFAKKLAGKQPEEEYAQTMVRESDRLNRVITDLLYLARPHSLAPTSVDLATICDEISSLLQFELHEQRVALHRTLDAMAVTADPDALKQALLNLLLNALEAMEGGSEVSGQTISVSANRGMENGIAGTLITVADSGPGMTKQEIEQACTPFFTTKKKGTGLGLALVKTIMQGHGGSVAIVSPHPAGNSGGCAVCLFFPNRSSECHTAESSET